jgi:hypothetical protein
MTFKFGNWPIFYKIMFTIMIIVLLALTITTAIHVSVLRTRMRDQIGAKFASLADTRMEYIVDTLSEQIALLRSIALDSTVMETLETANSRYSDDASTIEYMLLDTDRKWAAASDDNTLVQSIVDPTQNVLAAPLIAKSSLPIATVDWSRRRSGPLITIRRTRTGGRPRWPVEEVRSTSANRLTMRVPGMSRSIWRSQSIPHKIVW